MLYYLFNYLESLNFPGARLFTFISFRSAAAVITSLIISLLIGKRIILVSSEKTGWRGCQKSGTGRTVQEAGNSFNGRDNNSGFNYNSDSFIRKNRKHLHYSDADNN